MKPKHFTIVNIFLITYILKVVGVNCFAQVWTQKSDFGGIARLTAVGFSIGNYGYIGLGGNTGGTIYYDDFWQYNPANDTWAQKANFSGGVRAKAVGFSIGNYGYIGTGLDSNMISTKDFWLYDPNSNSWIQKADIGISGRYGAVGFSIGNKGYIGTGYSSTYSKDFWEYDTTNNSWTQKADFGGSGRYGAIGFSLGMYGYIGTGRNTSYLIDFWQYNSTNNSWSQKANFGGIGRANAVGFSIRNYGYIGTGAAPSTLQDFWQYNPVTDSWELKTNLLGLKRFGAVGFSIHYYGYIGTGFYAFEKNDFWQYCNINYSLSKTNISCNGNNDGSISISVIDGISPYGFMWSNGQTASALSALSIGTYTITITDSIGCSAIANVIITEPPILTVTTSSGNATCGNADGNAIVLVSGGVGFYTYQWDDAMNQTTDTANGLPAGTYNVTVTDSNNCIATKNVTVNNTGAPTLATLVVDVTCNGGNNGEATVTPAGGTVPFTYLWDASATSQSTQTATGLSAAIYSVTVTDSSLCVVFASVTINEPSALILDSLVMDKATCGSCYDGSAIVYASGGTLPYFFLWDDSMLQINDTASGLFPGYYTVCVTDVNGCSVCDSIFVDFNVGLELNNNEIQHKVFPNPTNGKFNIKIFNRWEEEKTNEIKIYDIFGKEILKIKTVKEKIMIDISKYDAGLYLLQIRNENNYYAARVVKY